MPLEMPTADEIDRAVEVLDRAMLVAGYLEHYEVGKTLVVIRNDFTKVIERFWETAGAPRGFLSRSVTRANANDGIYRAPGGLDFDWVDDVLDFLSQEVPHAQVETHPSTYCMRIRVSLPDRIVFIHAYAARCEVPTLRTSAVRLPQPTHVIRVSRETIARSGTRAKFYALLTRALGDTVTPMPHAKRPSPEVALSEEATGKPCPVCGHPMQVGRPGHPRARTIDHIYPRSKGGPRNAAANLWVICSLCNQRKGSRLPHEAPFPIPADRLRRLLAYFETSGRQKEAEHVRLALARSERSETQ